MTYYPFMYGVCESSLKTLKMRLDFEEYDKAKIEVEVMLELIALFDEKKPKGDECSSLFDENYERIKKEVKNKVFSS